VKERINAETTPIFPAKFQLLQPPVFPGKFCKSPLLRAKKDPAPAAPFKFQNYPDEAPSHLSLSM
jgi:hypothetical protein